MSPGNIHSTKLAFGLIDFLTKKYCLYQFDFLILLINLYREFCGFKSFLVDLDP